ncbi:MAG TPA: sulfatase-like hydrolase/transferase [Anaerolineales bacterium]|nr:sulfatase-like hydrolase/transferase [Anaerolineales bacterium]
MLKKQPLYPILFALFSVLSLASYNIREIFIGEVLRPLAFSLLVAGIVLWLAYLAARNAHRAGLVSSVVLLLFFTYGQVYSSFEGNTILGMALFRHRVLFPLFLVIGVIGVIWILRKISNPDTLTYGLNLISIFLLIYPTWIIASTLFQQFLANSSSRNSTSVGDGDAGGNNPDVYYIILDGYGRQDVLQNELGYDNSIFIEGLRDRGFFVAECSQTNYAHTLYSLSSSLNYEYLDALGATNDAERIALLKHSAVRTEFESRGYTIVAFPTGWSMTEWTDADIYPDFGRSFTTLTEFETLYLDTTMLRVATDYDRLNSKTTPYSNARRLRVLAMIDTLKEIPTREGNYFVFAHFVIPHPPYSFGADGEWLEINADTASYDEIKDAYLNQVEYINGEMLRIVDAIQARSEAVIIIQGDHGPPPDLTNDPAIKMPILNAYYLPGADADQGLYPSISPVNSFRVVLNRYFEAELPLLEDRSYFAPNQDRERIGLFPNACP